MKNLLIYQRKWLTALISLLLPAVLLTMAFALLGIYPFGEKSILSKDMFTQYVSYFSYYQSLFTGEGHNIFYSFSKLLGGDMFGFFSYYLISPFNLLCLFFSREQLPAALLLITVVKFSFAGLTMYLFLNRRRNPNPFLTLALSTSYAMMAYNIAFHINLMWLDGVILAPLILWGIEKLVHTKKQGGYIGFLALALICNYYIGFMLCLFSVIYFIYVLLLSGNLKQKAWFPPVRRFFISSLLAGGISSVIWLPTLLSLRGGIKNDFTLSALRLSSDCDFFDLFSRIYMGSYTAGSYANKLPYLFCGIGVLFLVLHFYMNPRISRLHKYGTLIIIAVFLASFYIEALNLIWHGLSEPIGFPFRYSFLFCLFLIDTAHASYEMLPEKTIYFKHSWRILAIFIGLTILVEKFHYEWLYTKIFVLELLFLLLITVLLHYSKGLLFRMALTGIICLELLCNAFLMMRQFPYEPYEKYTSHVSSLGDMVDTVKSGDPSFFRMEKQLQMAANDPLLLNYAGVSHFSSTVVEQDMTLVQSLGFERNTTYAFYNTGSTMAVDSLLGLKYLASYEPLYREYSIPYTVHDMYVNLNPYALPLGFLISEDASQTPVLQEDYFVMQNQMFQAMSSFYKEEQLFYPAPIIQTDFQNLQLSTEQEGLYSPIDSNQDAALSYALKTAKTGPLYARFASSALHRAEVLVNGESVSYYFADSDNGIITLGEFDAGETVQVDILLWEEQLSLTKPYFYSLEVSLLEQYYQELAAGPYAMTKLSDSHLTGQVHVRDQKNCLMLSLPYAEGWQVKVNGQKIEPEKAFASFLLVPLTAGSHTVELLYRPLGLIPALGTSLISILLTIGYLFPIRPAKRYGSKATS